MNLYIDDIRKLKSFLILWLTQSFSTLGSSMTTFALVIWSYEQHGSALETAMLSVSTYAPYVIMSIFAGALSDRWDKRITILVSDSFAAACTVMVFVFLQTGKMEIWHLYCLNAMNGLMNTVQQPAADVAVSLLTPKKYYQRVSGLRSLSSSLISIMTPVISSALMAFTGLKMILVFDLLSFAVAFLALFCIIRIPEVTDLHRGKEPLLQSAKSGLQYLRMNRGILDLILFLAAINFIVSIFNAAFPAMILSRAGGGKIALGMVNSVSGLAMLAGSMAASLLPAPKSRVRIIFNALLLSMSTENFFLAFGKSVPLWCIGAVLGWFTIPLMGTNMDVLLRNYIPIHMQGRVYSVRNTLQFFPIPIGYLVGGLLVDRIFEPFMASQQFNGVLTVIFGAGKGSGAAMLFFFLGIGGVLTCALFRKNPYIWELES